MTVTTAGTTRELAASLGDLRFEDLPREVVDRTEGFFLDRELDVRGLHPGV
jgi:hypothetical protein